MCARQRGVELTFLGNGVVLLPSDVSAVASRWLIAEHWDKLWRWGSMCNRLSDPIVASRLVPTWRGRLSVVVAGQSDDAWIGKGHPGGDGVYAHVTEIHATEHALKTATLISCLNDQSEQERL